MPTNFLNTQFPRQILHCVACCIFFFTAFKVGVEAELDFKLGIHNCGFNLYHNQFQ